MNNYIINNNLNSGNAVFDTHLHDTYEINFMLSEGVEVMIEDKFFFSKRGDIFIFPPFTFHKINSKNAPFSRFLMFFDEAEMLSASATLSPAFSLLKESRPFVVHLNDLYTKKMIELFSAANDARKKEHLMYDFNNICCFGKILNFIVENMDQTSYNIERTNTHEISTILSYVNNNIAENITVEGIAKKFNLSTTTLWHMMRKSIGISLKEYILKIRIAKAMELLNNGLSVTEASNRAGFNSYSHFIRTFTKAVGISPYQYGKRNSRAGL